MTMPTSERQPNRRKEHLTDAQLNELVDGTLVGRELDTAREHLASCPECDERYRTLLATVSALRHAPSVMPRRSFQLTPEQARLSEKKPGWLDRLADRLLPGVPAIKAATIAVALLLVSVTAFDVLTNQSGQDDPVSETSVMREADLPAPTGAFEQAAATEPPLLEEVSDTAADDGEAASTLQESETDSEIGEAEGALGAAETGGSDAEAPEPADNESFASSAMQEVPPAPAAAMQAPTVAATPTTEATSTASPEPTETPSATATATPAPDDTSSGANLEISRWRIAELGLLMILLWLIVSWVGRSRVGQIDE